MVGRQTPFLALIVPIILVGIVDGRRGLKAGVARRARRRRRVRRRAVRLLELHLRRARRHRRLARRHARDRRACSGLAAGRAAARRAARMRPAARCRRWPAGSPEARRRWPRRPRARTRARDVAARLRAVPHHHRRLLAGAAQRAAVQGLPRRAARKEFTWPGLDIVTPDGDPLAAATFVFNWRQRGGHAAAHLSGLITMLVLRDQAEGRAVGVRPLARPAQVGDPHGRLRAGAGLRHELLGPDDHDRPVAGRAPAASSRSCRRSWAGWASAVTGSDTSSNSLFGALQVAAAKKADLDPVLMAAANSSGGVLGEDDLAAEPRDRRRRGGHGGSGRRALPPCGGMEPDPRPAHVRSSSPCSRPAILSWMVV